MPWGAQMLTRVSSTLLLWKNVSLWTSERGRENPNSEGYWTFRSLMGYMVDGCSETISINRVAYGRISCSLSNSSRPAGHIYAERLCKTRV